MRQFTDLAEATAEAKLKAQQLAAGKLDATSITADDANTLIEMRRLAGETSIAAAMQEWRKARDLVGSDLLHACEQWAQRQGKDLPTKTVGAAVTEFVAAKRRQGVEMPASYERSLPAFKKAFENSQLRNLSASVMQGGLGRTFAHRHTVSLGA